MNAQKLSHLRKAAWMREAIRLSANAMRRNLGGPFGALIVRKGKIIARGFNKVTSSGDPTAHAEIVAIRAACRKLKTFSLRGCEIYCSCEPCPMCLAAIYWARMGRIYFAATKRDAARIGFDDGLIYAEMTRSMRRRRVAMIRLLRQEGLKIFEEWQRKADKVLY
jgi:tRNA(Arg) A34 adenosine deaminase TadA